MPEHPQPTKDGIQVEVRTADGDKEIARVRVIDWIDSAVRDVEIAQGRVMTHLDEALQVVRHEVG